MVQIPRDIAVRCDSLLGLIRHRGLRLTEFADQHEADEIIQAMRNSYERASSPAAHSTDESAGMLASQRATFDSENAAAEARLTQASSLAPRVAALLAKQPRIAVTADGQVSTGYDGIEAAPSADDSREAYDLNPADVWTAEERAQLADAMITRWAAYKARR